MFGEYLKQTREQLGLTQTELVTKLNLADEEFLSLDGVTLSRWERGKTTPSLSKCIRILRCLKLDLSDFYNLLPNPDEHEMFNEIAQIRFHSHLSKLSSSSYESTDQPDPTQLIERPLLMNDSDEVWNNLKAFYDQLGYTPPHLLDVNLFEYQKNKRAVCKKFVSNEDEQLMGHSISFLFPLDYFERTIQGKAFTIDLTHSLSYKETSRMAGCNYNRYSANYEVFRYILASQFRNLIKHSNVHRYYFFNVLPNFNSFMEKLGFEKIAVDVESKFGGVKIGNKRFERCLYGIDSDKLLSRPEIITLIKTIN
ncbi:helix-turn-helix transcriptional regulator [Vibrio vulnificus]|uniref:helix-turn-helix domain-containing protein n=1 Tax=Vibrio vulnificus TaxID=672 RepID=UPI001D8FEFBA|nr:helix-turn-helix transcriptional regulator [Vibrio vulnificus]